MRREYEAVQAAKGSQEDEMRAMKERMMLGVGVELQNCCCIPNLLSSAGLLDRVLWHRPAADLLDMEQSKANSAQQKYPAVTGVSAQPGAHRYMASFSSSASPTCLAQLGLAPFNNSLQYPSAWTRAIPLRL